MVPAGNNFFPWNQSAPPSPSHLCTKVAMGCWISGHCCRLALGALQSWKLYLAFLGCYILLCYPRALPNASPVAYCLAFPSSSPHKPHLHIFSKPSQPTVTKFIQWYRNFPNAARSRKSPKNQQMPSRSAGVHLPTVSHSSSRHNGLTLLLEKPSHSYFVPLVECTKVGLPHPFGKLLQAVFRLLHADWGIAFGPAQVESIIALSNCIEFVMTNLW